MNRQHKKIVKVDLTSTRERKRFEVESPEVALALFRKAHRTVDDRSNVTLRVLVAWFVERCKVCHNVDLQDLTKTSHRRCAVHLHTTQAGTARSRHAEQAGPVMKLAGRREIRRVSLPRRYRDRRSCAYTRPAARPGAAGRRLTQAQLADLASVTYQEISHDEAGRRQRPIDRAIQIAEILGWDVQELWGISDREEK